jgi:hypothetical protein
MTKILSALLVVAVLTTVAGEAFALNPQPLPPRCLPGVKCGGGPGIKTTVQR